MTFMRPVDHRFPVIAHFGELGEHYDYEADPMTGFWMPKTSKIGHHRGTDFACPIGTPVRAIADGMVVKSRYDSDMDHSIGDGLHVIQVIMMPGYDAWWAKYSRLSRSHVAIGQRIKQGDVIGKTGESGYTTNPKLHVDLANTNHQYHPILWAETLE